MFKPNIRQLFMQYKFNVHNICSILNLLRTEQELESLVLWAKRKRLKDVRKYYESMLMGLQNKILIFRVKNPRVFTLAKFLQVAETQILPRPTYKKGFAKKYQRRRNII